jgi:hypothetical protein
MDYELAKQLKNAGFPNIKDLQHRQGREFILPDGSVPVYSLGDVEHVKDWFIPTLSELIEACGDKFAALHNNLGVWTALGRHSFDPFQENHDTRADGVSPEEAVARLWLAVHPMNETYQGKNRPAR